MLFLIMSFLEVTMLLCSHQILVHSSCLLCGHHAVEAAQGKVSQVLSKQAQRGTRGRQQVVMGGSR